VTTDHRSQITFSGEGAMKGNIEVIILETSLKSKKEIMLHMHRDKGY
jgi:hypothetical protein